MYTLIADCSNFVLEHGVHIIDPDCKTVALMQLPINELVDFILHEPKITEVKLSGIAEYCYGLKEEIENKMALEYANDKRKIEIEVI